MPIKYKTQVCVILCSKFQALHVWLESTTLIWKFIILASINTRRHFTRLLRLSCLFFRWYFLLSNHTTYSNQFTSSSNYLIAILREPPFENRTVHGLSSLSLHTVFQYSTPYDWVCIFRRFERTFCLRLKFKWVFYHGAGGCRFSRNLIDTHWGMNIKPHIVNNLLVFFVSHAKRVAQEMLRDMSLPYPERDRPSKSHELNNYHIWFSTFK